MRHLRLVLFAALLAVVLGFSTQAQARVFVGVGIGPVIAPVPYAYGPPSCDYGYYSYYPYDCAPYGYYGSEWFRGGIFIGAGPWFHGPKTFHGHVDNHFDENHGYKGPAPSPGDKPEPGKPLEKIAHFNGNEVRDGRGRQSAQLKH